jgi:hypothetical protein
MDVNANANANVNVSMEVVEGDLNEGSGAFMVIGQDRDDKEACARWEYWLTLANIIAISRPMVPTDACIATIATIDEMEKARLRHCAGLIVVIGEVAKGDKPFVSLHDYKLIMQALNYGQRVYTTRRMAAKELDAERTVHIHSLDPAAPEKLWSYYMEDHLAQFGPRKGQKSQAAASEGPLLLDTPVNGERQ